MSTKNKKREEITNLLEKVIEKNELSTLYKKGYINYTGKVSDFDEFYSDIITEYLLGKKVKSLYDNKNIVEPIKREPKKYKVKDHKPMTDKEKSLIHKQIRKEEWIARSLLNEKFDDIGEIIDYQIPIKGKITDSAGKVDLLAYNDKNKILTLIELKREDSKETMLRSILEISTYYAQINKNQLKNDFGYPSETNIQKAIFVFKESSLYKHYKDTKLVKKLIDEEELNIKIYFVEKNGNKYSIKVTP